MHLVWLCGLIKPIRISLSLYVFIYYQARSDCQRPFFSRSWDMLGKQFTVDLIGFQVLMLVLDNRLFLINGILLLDCERTSYFGLLPPPLHLIMRMYLNRLLMLFGSLWEIFLFYFCLFSKIFFTSSELYSPPIALKVAA